MSAKTKTAPAFTPEEVAALSDLSEDEQRTLLGDRAPMQRVVAEPLPVPVTQDKEDAGDLFRAQDERMKAYFKDAERKTFQNMTGEDLRLEINGYVVRVKAGETKSIPIEFLDLIEEKARIERKHALLSGVYLARGRRPISAPGTLTF